MTPKDPFELLAQITAEADAALERINQAQERHRSALAEIRRQADQVRVDHKAASRAARRDLTAVPPMPELPDGQAHRDALRELVHLRSDVAARRRAALAAALPDVMDAWAEAKPKLEAKARDIVQPVEELAETYVGWWSLLRVCRQAGEGADPTARITNGPSTRMRPRPEPQDVLLAAAGIDLCSVRPFRTRPAPVTGEEREDLTPILDR